MKTLSGIYSELSRSLAPFLAAEIWKPAAAYVYNPLEYAWEPFRLYLERTGEAKKDVLFLGMNPGPWGMTQTGVPFGNVELVKNWLRIEAPVGRPLREHPQRPVEGFACRRQEVSGARLWGYFSRLFPDPRDFFARGAVLSFCPLVFMDEGGRNITPDHLPKAPRLEMEALCGRALEEIVRILGADRIMALGKYALTQLDTLRTRLAAKGEVPSWTTVLLPHPSPANPQARDWEAKVGAILQKNAVWLDKIGAETPEK